ncbi:hypothetical protein [Prosthecobacter sp.]|uniref:hypothetical protein n=1 Tax=Prosthecobacter sp. TaxID=1965333 RepID=UPI00378385B9
MRPALITASLLTLSACGKIPTKLTTPPLPKVAIADIPAPPAPTIIVEKGSTLRDIAAAAYHSDTFSGFVGQLNGIPKPELLKAGATLKTPSLPVALRDAGLDPQYQPAANALSKAWADLSAILPDYLRVRDASGIRDGGRFALPEKIKKVLLTCAETLDAAINVLQHPGAGHVAPRATIGSFKEASTTLQSMAKGNVESFDYETFILEQKFGRGFTNLLLWVQNHHK